LPLRAAVHDIKALAAVVRSYRATGHSGAILVVNPVPPTAALEEDAVEKWVAQALQEVDEQGVSGSAVTPFLLQKMNELSGGATLQANKALLLSNAELAACLAAALSGRKQR
jgi:pseudouridine-5'-phosphate glycosidase